MLQFSEQFTDEKIVVTLSRQLSWSHIITILPIKNRDAQLYYSRIIAESSLSVRDLRKKITNKEFERASIANYRTQVSILEYKIILKILTF